MMVISFLKYCIVGFSGVVVDFSITYLFKEKVGINKYVGSMLGFSTSFTSNYVLNRIWTFANGNPEILEQYFSFLIISVIGLSLNTLFLYLFQRIRINYYLSKGFAIIIVTIWNYMANSMITFG